MTETGYVHGIDRDPEFSTGFTLETAPPRRSYPAATTRDSEEADVCESEPGLWNVWGRLPITRETGALMRAGVSFASLFVPIALSALTRHRLAHQGDQNGQGAMVLAGLLRSLLTAPAAVLTLYLVARYVLMRLRDSAETKYVAAEHGAESTGSLSRRGSVRPPQQFGTVATSAPIERIAQSWAALTSSCLLPLSVTAYFLMA